MTMNELIAKLIARKKKAEWDIEAKRVEFSNAKDIPTMEAIKKDIMMMQGAYLAYTEILEQLE